MAIFDISYVGEMPYLKLTGGIVTGETTFNDNLAVSTINGVAVGSNPQFTDTTYSVATTSTNGLMAATDKTAVNKIGTGTLNTTSQTLIGAINELKSNGVVKYYISNVEDTSASKNIYMETCAITQKAGMPEGSGTSHNTIVFYNNKVHVLGGTNGKTLHHFWNGSSWTSYSTLPVNFSGTAVVDANGYLNILGGIYSTNEPKCHYRLNGTTWTSVSTLPIDHDGSSILDSSGKINILGGNSSSGNTVHYIYNGSSWTSKSTLPYNWCGEPVLDSSGYINILSKAWSGDSNRNHYRYNGSSWTSVSTLPAATGTNSTGFIPIVDKNKVLHIFKSYLASENPFFQSGFTHYVFKNNQWKAIHHDEVCPGYTRHSRSAVIDTEGNFHSMNYNYYYTITIGISKEETVTSGGTYVKYY